MHRELLGVVTNLGSPRVLLVGDFVLDSYVYGDAVRISPEAPVQVLKVVDRQYSCGGAASVAADITALGARCFCVGVVGEDSNARLLMDLLSQAGADTSGLVAVGDRPTTSKERLVGLAQHRHRQQLLRIDEESDEPLTDEIYRRLVGLYKERLSEADVVCLQDYDKGVLGGDICGELIGLAREADKTIVVDPPMRNDYSKYSGATLITPNRREASRAVGFDIETVADAAKAADDLAAKFGIEGVVITLDKEGAFVRTNDLSEHISTVPRSVYDVPGAGDMVLAMLAVSLAAGCDYRAAVELANIAGGIEVEKFGVATVTVDEIANEILAAHRHKAGKRQDIDSLVGLLDFHRDQNETIVFTNGCFDVLHRGHTEYLKFCRDHGDIVVLGLNGDSSVKEIKGPGRPVNNVDDRAAVLAALEMIDYIVVFDEADPLELIKKVKPDVLVKGVDWAQKGVVGREFVESYGGKVVLADLVEGKSSTATIEKLKKLNQTED